MFARLMPVPSSSPRICLPLISSWVLKYEIKQKMTGFYVFVCLLLRKHYHHGEREQLKHHARLLCFSYTNLLDWFLHRIEQLLEHAADRAFTFPSTLELRRLINIVNIYYCSDHLKWKIREHFYVLGTKCFYIDYLIPIIIILVFQCRKLFREVK